LCESASSLIDVSGLSDSAFDDDLRPDPPPRLSRPRMCKKRSNTNRNVLKRQKKFVTKIQKRKNVVQRTAVLQCGTVCPQPCGTENVHFPPFTMTLEDQRRFRDFGAVI